MQARGNVGGDLATIRETTAELVSAVNASDVNRVLDVWADSGILMPPAHPAVHGRTALREYFARLFVHARFAFEFVSSEVELTEDVAFERVSYRVTVRPSDGQSPTDDWAKGCTSIADKRTAVGSSTSTFGTAIGRLSDMNPVPGGTS